MKNAFDVKIMKNTFDVETYKLQPRPLWTATEAIAFVNELENEFSNVGWHCALTGGVLFNGSSDKDLDIVVYPHQKIGAKPLFHRVRRVLSTLGWCQVRTVGQLRKYWRSKGLKDMKHVEVWLTPDDRRVDFLVLS